MSLNATSKLSLPGIRVSSTSRVSAGPDTSEAKSTGVKSPGVNPFGLPSYGQNRESMQKSDQAKWDQLNGKTQAPADNAKPSMKLDKISSKINEAYQGLKETFKQSQEPKTDSKSGSGSRTQSEEA